MRDGSINDIVAMWSAQMMSAQLGKLLPHETPSAIYFAMLKHAAYGLIQPGRDADTDENTFEKISALLHEIRAKFYCNDDIWPSQNIDSDEDEQPELKSEIDNPADHSPNSLKDYWESDRWKKDFFTTFSRWIWSMKDYAHAAARPKMDFMWDVTEVWIVAGATALVCYSKDDKHRWFETAQMLRQYADLVEEDGLRTLPWGRWARYASRNRMSE
jgi:hypothetical protein